MGGFQVLTALIGLVIISAFVWWLVRIRDVFHPLAYLLPMIFFLYVYLPFELIEYDVLQVTHFSIGTLVGVQALNGVCILAVILGTLRGGAKSKIVRSAEPIMDFATRRGAMFGIAIFLGIVSLVAFAINLNNVGGLFEAYAQEKGGGTAESGYTRDAVFLSVSAVAVLAVCIREDGIRLPYVIAGLIFASPMFIHGLLGARRGPTFIAFATVTATYYLGNRKRPAFFLFLGGGLLIGLLLMLIVTFREQFRIGSDLFQKPAETLSTMIEDLDSVRSESRERTLEANEFIYGIDVVHRFATGVDQPYWGRRILTIVFIRPIPSQIWENKYLDVGMARYLVNVGLGGVDEVSAIAYGSAPGFVADLFAEFSWGVVPVCFLIGWAYGRIWRNAEERGGVWLPIYVLFVAFSIFFVMQTMEAVLYRILFTSVPIILLWAIFVRRKNVVAQLEPVPS